MSVEKKVKCPVCDESFQLDSDLEIGNTVCCSGCCVDLRVTKLNPPKLEEVMDSNIDNYDDEGDGDQEEDEF
ncbi:MAG: hypothetical protein KKH25_05480 [Candidatus Omnitrophica bacterium]|nr:hypothetical protein [Candidatus Omnitrophota bacterium]MBU2473936.1 hypothetical protein [Candidatus Omnitrophota bacterium]